jgi:hypothetical protein
MGILLGRKSASEEDSVRILPLHLPRLPEDSLMGFLATG